MKFANMKTKPFIAKNVFLQKKRLKLRNIYTDSY